MDTAKFYSMCLHGSVTDAIKYLETFDEKDTNKDIVELKQKYQARFFDDSEVCEVNSDDPWIKEVVFCYFDYFKDVLTGKSVDKAEKCLIDKLNKLVSIGSKTKFEFEDTIDQIETELDKKFNEKGYSFVGGITPPYRGPYIWKTTSQQRFNVSLIDSIQEVTVYFISDFVMMSWAHFATFGKRHAGGWATSEGLYYVNTGEKPIDIESTEFQVWFLKHEAQHLNDYKRFPNLNARNLEYRAKLTELVYNPEPHTLIEKFANDAKDNKALPHPYASYSIIKNLSLLIFDKEEYVNDKQQWWKIKSDDISKASKELFLQSTKSLTEAGSETEGII